MLFFAGMIGMVAIGSVAFLGLGDDDDVEPQDAGEGSETDESETPQPVMDVGGLLGSSAPDEMPDAGEDQADASEFSGLPGAVAELTGAVDAGAGETGAEAPTGEPPVPGMPDIDQADVDQVVMQVEDGEGGDTPADPDDSWAIETGSEEGDTVEGTDGSDFLMGYAGDDLVLGGVSDDQAEGGLGDDTLEGGVGDDALHGNEGHDLAQGGAGEDDLYGHGGDDALDGGAGADSLVGGQGNDLLSGGAGDDALHGYHGNDTLAGGPGEDTLFGGLGDDVVSGLGPDGEDDGETDYLNGGDGGDHMTAGARDVATGGDGADTVVLGASLGGAAEIMDFAPEEDNLLIEYDPEGGDPQVEVAQDQDDAETYRVTLDGVEVAVVHSTGGLQAGDIVLVPQGAI